MFGMNIMIVAFGIVFVVFVFRCDDPNPGE
jgi:hypothetical protein